MCNPRARESDETFNSVCHGQPRLTTTSHQHNGQPRSSHTYSHGPVQPGTSWPAAPNYHLSSSLRLPGQANTCHSLSQPAPSGPGQQHWYSMLDRGFAQSVTLCALKIRCVQRFAQNFALFGGWGKSAICSICALCAPKIRCVQRFAQNFALFFGAGYFP